LLRAPFRRAAVIVVCDGQRAGWPHGFVSDFSLFGRIVIPTASDMSYLTDHGTPSG
jgi:hypothetical protein